MKHSLCYALRRFKRTLRAGCIVFIAAVAGLLAWSALAPVATDILPGWWWLDVRSIRVEDAPQGVAPAIHVDRTIRRAFWGRWAATIWAVGDGGTLLHWADGAEGQGALLAGDIFQVVQDRRWVSFMYSYPNLIPERSAIIREALRRVEPYAFDHLYGAWWDRKVMGDAQGAVWRSAERYLARIES